MKSYNLGVLSPLPLLKMKKIKIILYSAKISPHNVSFFCIRFQSVFASLSTQYIGSIDCILPGNKHQAISWPSVDLSSSSPRVHLPLLWQHRFRFRFRHRSGINIGSGNGFLPDGTKQLPEPMMNYHQ